jgi:hypothetical protein
MWTKLGDDFPDDAAREELSDAAVRTHVEALCWSNRLLRDGRIPKRELHRFAFSEAASDAVAELVAAGWWADDGTAWLLLHDQTEQPEASVVLARREAGKRRQRAWRQRQRGQDPDPERDGSRNAVTRDGSGRVWEVKATTHLEKQLGPAEIARKDGPSAWSS